VNRQHRTLNPVLFLAISAFLLASVPLSAQEATALYVTKCAACHGKDALGQTPMGLKLKVRDLHSPEVQKETDAALRQIITKGKAKMPAFETKFSKEQIDGLVAYVRSLAAKK
jgi:mono/diheme cytochrome c family protein